MSVHPGSRHATFGIRKNVSGAGRDDDAVLYGTSGEPSDGTTANGDLATNQVGIATDCDATGSAPVLYATKDGGTSFQAFAMAAEAGVRIELDWIAGQAQAPGNKPGINADILNATESTRMVTDGTFEILGTNASSDDVTINAEGGLLFTTDGADGDEVILLPHLDTNQSAWTSYTWGTDQETRYECWIKTGSAAQIDNCIIWAGLKLTNTEVTATDDDQAFFRYENGVNTGKWQAISSIGGTDDAADSGVTVAAATLYHLRIDIDSSRLAKFYINGTLVETSAALTDATDLIPYIGVAADGAAEAKILKVYRARISRNVA